MPRPQIALIRLHVPDRTFRETPLFVVAQPKLEGCDDDAGETFLYRKDVLERAIVVLGPDMVVPARIDQLRAYSQLVSTQRTLPCRTYWTPSSWAMVLTSFFVSLKTIEDVREMTRSAAPSRIGNHLLRQAVREECVLRISAQIRERQHRDRFG